MRESDILFVAKSLELSRFVGTKTIINKESWKTFCSCFCLRLKDLFDPFKVDPYVIVSRFRDPVILT